MLVQYCTNMAVLLGRLQAQSDTRAMCLSLIHYMQCISDTKKLKMAIIKPVQFTRMLHASFATETQYSYLQLGIAIPGSRIPGSRDPGPFFNPEIPGL